MLRLYNFLQKITQILHSVSFNPHFSSSLFWVGFCDFSRRLSPMHFNVINNTFKINFRLLYSVGLDDTLCTIASISSPTQSSKEIEFIFPPKQQVTSWRKSYERNPLTDRKDASLKMESMPL